MQKIESVQTMWILIISLVLLGIIALIAGYIRNKRLQQKIEKGELDRMPEVKEADIECCGQHEVCEKDSLLAAVSKKLNITMTKNWISSSERKQMRILTKKQTNSGMCYIPCRTLMSQVGYVVCNYGVSSCRMTSKMKSF